MASGRQFNEREVGAILRRAAEMQAGDGPADGTSLEQLRQAAAELGLDPALIERAANELANEPDASWWVRLLGGPWSAFDDRYVDETISEREWPALLAKMRETTGRTGDSQRVGDSFEWLSKTPDHIHVSLIPSGTRTRVKSVARFHQYLGAFYGLPAVLSAYPLVLAMQCFAAGRIAEAMAISMAPLALFGAGRWGAGRLNVRKRREFEQLVQTISNATTTESSPVQAARALEDESLEYKRLSNRLS